MRISTSEQYTSYVSSIDSVSQTMYADQQQVETGKAINQPSDNPVAATQIINMTALQSAQTQYGANLTTAKGWLGNTSTALTSAGNIMQSAYSLALQGASSNTTQDQRVAMASQIQQLETSLVGLANSKGSDGSYLFAGQKSSTPPLTVSGNTATYNGDTNAVLVETGANQTMAVNTPGSPLFTTAYSNLESLRQNLLNGNQTAISNTDVSNMQSSLTGFTTEQGNVGAKIQNVTNLTTDYTRRNNDLTTQISNVQDVDMAQAITKYQLASTAYQAALTVTSQGFGLNLANFIK